MSSDHFYRTFCRTAFFKNTDKSVLEANNVK